MPTARGVLSMGAYRAAPALFARVDGRTGSPVAATLGWAFVRNVRDTWAEDYGYTIIFGRGGVFVIGIGAIALGVVLMALWRTRAPAFFRGETFAPGYIQAHRPDLIEELRL